MKRCGAVVLVVGLLLALFMPSSSAKIDPTLSFTGSSQARALDLDVPAFRNAPSSVPAQVRDTMASFKGLTIGLTRAEFSYNPTSLTGVAAARCEFVAASVPSSGPFPCEADDHAITSVSGQGSQASDRSCRQTHAIPPGTTPVIKLETVCHSSKSSIVSGNPNGNNEAGVGRLQVSLDLTPLTLEDDKDAAIDSLSEALEDVFEEMGSPVPSGDRDALRAGVANFLDRLKDDQGQAVAVKLGLSNTDVTDAGNSVKAMSQAAGATIGILGLEDALTDGLIVIEVSASNAWASLDRASMRADGDSIPAIATLKVRDLRDPAGGYLIKHDLEPADVTPILSALGNLPEPLRSMLATEVKVAQTSKSVSGQSVSVSTSAVTIHALKGLHESSPSEADGGVFLRLAYADATLAAVLGQQIQPPHPTTGGPVYIYFGAAAILGLAAPLLFIWSRRLRKSDRTG